MTDETISIFTLKGVWLKPNEFVDEVTGEVISVLPYKNIEKEYRGTQPIHCYIQFERVKEFNIIKNVIIIDDEDDE